MLYHHHQSKTIFITNIAIQNHQTSKNFFSRSKDREMLLSVLNVVHLIITALGDNYSCEAIEFRDNGTTRAVSENIVTNRFLKCNALSPQPWLIYCGNLRHPFTSLLLLTKTWYFVWNCTNAVNVWLAIPLLIFRYFTTIGYFTNMV